MAIGISPLVDYAFKLMLGSPEHSGITVHFLNAILVGQPKITQVTFLNPILGMETDDDKLAVLDILATDEHGRRLNIEMQTSVPAGMSQRLTYYVASSFPALSCVAAPANSLGCQPKVLRSQTTPRAVKRRHVSALRARAAFGRLAPGKLDKKMWGKNIKPAVDDPFRAVVIEVVSDWLDSEPSGESVS